IKALNKVRPDQLSADEYRALKGRYEKVAKQISILGMSDQIDETRKPLRIRFSELTPAEKPAVLRLDALQNREEFYSLQTLLESLPLGLYSLDDVSKAASRYFFEESRNVGLRIANLGIREWGVWAKPDEASMPEILKQRRRCTVIDIGAL